MTRSYTPSQIADGLLAGEFTGDSAFVPLAEVKRLKARPAEAEIGRLDVMWQALVRERDEALADVDRLRGDREKMLLDERDFVRKHRAEIERLTRERDEARDVVARQRARRKLRLLEMKP